MSVTMKAKKEKMKMRKSTANLQSIKIKTF